MVTDSPAFMYHVVEKDGKIKVLNYSTITMKNDTLDGFVDLINNESLNDKFIVFYLINKKIIIGKFLFM